jgi:hypothetical protein
MTFTYEPNYYVKYLNKKGKSTLPNIINSEVYSYKISNHIDGISINNKGILSFDKNMTIGNYVIEIELLQNDKVLEKTKFVLFVRDPDNEDIGDISYTLDNDNHTYLDNDNNTYLDKKKSRDNLLDDVHYNKISEKLNKYISKKNGYVKNNKKVSKYHNKKTVNKQQNGITLIVISLLLMIFRIIF